MKNFNTFILEKKINKIDPKEIYNKYYTDLDSDVFYKIIEADPTSTIDGKVYVGKYSKWLLKMYKDENLKLEDLYKATEYLEIFDKESVRNKLELNKRNINNYLLLSDLAKVILPFKEDKTILSKAEIKEDNLVMKFKNYNLYIPKTFKDSCILGKGTEWCTATENTDKYFRMYHKPGRELLIFISNKDKSNKYQLHLRSKQFMNRLDEEEKLHNFLIKNQDISDWLEMHYEKEFKRYFNDEHIDSWQEYLNLGSPKIVESDFYCNNNNLNTLEGGPEIVEGYFNCSNNNLSTLKGCPEIVEGYFNCSNNNLSTLKGCPEIVEGNFYCSNNNLISLEGSPEIVEGDFYCLLNKLISLEGCPKKIEGNFDCSSNKITTLKWFPEIVEGNFYCSFNKISWEEIDELEKSGKIKGTITYIP